MLSVGLPGGKHALQESRFARPPFFDLAPEEMVKESSVILLTEWRRAGNGVSLVVTEILKRRPGTTLYYSVGDEYEPPSADYSLNQFTRSEPVMVECPIPQEGTVQENAKVLPRMATGAVKVTT